MNESQSPLVLVKESTLIISLFFLMSLMAYGCLCGEISSVEEHTKATEAILIEQQEEISYQVSMTEYRKYIHQLQNDSSH